MQISFLQAKKDFISFFIFHGWYAQDKKAFRTKTKVMLGLVMAIPYMILVVFSESIKTYSPLVLIGLGIVFFLLGFAFAKRTTIRTLTRAAKKAIAPVTEFTGEKVLTLLPGELKWKSETAEGINKIEKIEEDINFFYLYISENTAWIVPKSIFKARYNMEEFRIAALQCKG